MTSTYYYEYAWDGKCFYKNKINRSSMDTIWLVLRESNHHVMGMKISKNIEYKIQTQKKEKRECNRN